MQLTKKSAAVRVNPINRNAVVNAGNTKLRDTPFYHLLLLLAEGCDSNARDVNFYATLGATKKGDSLTLSINLDGDRQTLYAVSLAEVATACGELHDAA